MKYITAMCSPDCPREEQSIEEYKKVMIIMIINNLTEICNWVNGNS